MGGGKRDKKGKARRVSEPKALQNVFFGKPGSALARELATEEGQYEKLGLLASPVSTAAQTHNVKSENLSVHDAPFDVTSDIFQPVSLGNEHRAGRNDEPERDSLDAETIHEPAGLDETHSNMGAASEVAHRARSSERISSSVSSRNRYSPDQEVPREARPAPSYLSASRTTSSSTDDKGRSERDNSPVRNGGSGGGGGGKWLSSAAAQQRGGWLSSAVAQQRERARRNFEEDENDAVELMVRDSLKGDGYPASDEDVGGGGGHGLPPEKCSDWRAFVSILKSYIGSGVLGLPFAYSQGGMVAGVAPPPAARFSPRLPRARRRVAEAFE